MSLREDRWMGEKGYEQEKVMVKANEVEGEAVNWRKDKEHNVEWLGKFIRKMYWC
jgi:hypothetical protein